MGNLRWWKLAVREGGGQEAGNCTVAARGQDGKEEAGNLIGPDRRPDLGTPPVRVFRTPGLYSTIIELD